MYEPDGVAVGIVFPTIAFILDKGETKVLDHAVKRLESPDPGVTEMSAYPPSYSQM
jgi:hypothetical protein